MDLAGVRSRMYLVFSQTRIVRCFMRWVEMLLPASMVQEKYGVRLSTPEKRQLRQVISTGKSSARAITRGVSW